MKKTIVTVLMAFIVISAFSQSSDQPITIEKKKYYQDGKKLTITELKTILSGSSPAAADYKLYKRNMNIAAPFMIGGGVLILAAGIVSLSSSAQEAKDIDNGVVKDSYPSGLGLAIAGLGCVLVSVPFSVSARKHLNNSVDAYNSSLNEDFGKIPLQFNLIVNSNGVGVVMKF